ncbi:MAG: M23 family metallopeptidase [Dehalococcoidia bacterium]|nr:M23 family metallopeptidase [Dehalococcoidia bacterium]
MVPNDLSAETVVGAPFSGLVTFAGKDERPELLAWPQSNRGYYVEITDLDDSHRVTRLVHLKETLLVTPDQRVGQGDPVGYVGWTGYTIPKGPGGKHLHWALLVDSEYVDPLV